MRQVAGPSFHAASPFHLSPDRPDTPVRQAGRGRPGAARPRRPLRAAGRAAPRPDAPTARMRGSCPGMSDRPRLVGINHVALEVGDLEEALEFYGAIFEVRLRGREPGMAFVDMGDQFIALSEGRTAPPDGSRHFGLGVDDKEAVRAALERAGVRIE